jgi:Zn finger protein HypA/HybF involved in hydrogenase expression
MCFVDAGSSSIDIEQEDLEAIRYKCMDCDSIFRVIGKRIKCPTCESSRVQQI